MKILGIDETHRSNFMHYLPVCGVLTDTDWLPDNVYDSKAVKNGNLLETRKLYSRYVIRSTIVRIPESLLDTYNVLDLELEAIKFIVQENRYSFDIIELDFLGKKKDYILKYLGLSDSQLVYKPKLDQQSKVVGMASVYAKADRYSFEQDIKMPLCDYHYNQLSKMSFEEAIAIPGVRKRWIHSYFCRKYPDRVKDFNRIYRPIVRRLGKNDNIRMRRVWQDGCETIFELEID